MRVSVVSTLYLSSKYLGEFLDRVRHAVSAVTDDYEIVLVNDGSPDTSLADAVRYAKSEPRIVIVDLSRNFGHHKAAMTGLSYATGDLVFFIDSDLEEQPELFSRFYESLVNGGCDVVYGVQRQRRGGLFRRGSGFLFYSIFNWLSDTRVPRNLTMVRLMTRRYVDALLQHRERELYFAGLLFLTGFEQLAVEIDKPYKGSTSYSLTRRFEVAVNSIVSFSNKPLQLIFYVGALISSLAGAYIVALLVLKLVYGIAVSGWASLIVSVWFLGGLTILFLGVIGIYISKIFIETKHRPYSIVRQVIRNGRQVVDCHARR